MHDSGAASVKAFCMQPIHRGPVFTGSRLWDFWETTGFMAARLQGSYRLPRLCAGHGDRRRLSGGKSQRGSDQHECAHSALQSRQSRRGGSCQRHRQGVCSSRAVAAVSGGGGLPPAPSAPGISAARQPAQPSPDSPLIMERRSAPSRQLLRHRGWLFQDADTRQFWTAVDLRTSATAQI